MKEKDVIKLLIPGIVVGLVLGFILGIIIGVDTENEVPNFINAAMVCCIPTLLNTIVVLKMGASKLNRKLPLSKAILRALIYAICGFILGIILVALLGSKILGINTCEISKLTTAIYQAILGTIVSTIFAYVAFKQYMAKVKYTRR